VLVREPGQNVADGAQASSGMNTRFRLTVRADPDGVEQPISDQSASDQSVELTAGAYRVRSSRVSLDSIVWAFLSGQSAEAIARSFPVLTVEQVDAALTY